ncbi:mitochondrial carrier domain-containing protein [Aspergillus cavernicola]|uniref:Mitochondrial thiamine pyrophosphate carrier 1 n=1 Tax=Aspergillus cavernicola TaxID=176166 RepID=A0ABR4IFX3_9EURO
MTGGLSTPDPADKRNLNYVLRTGLAGGVAGCAAKTIVAPLERVRILFQTSHFQFIKHTTSWSGLFDAMKDIRQMHGGISALFKGHSATLLRIFPYAGINFLAYEQIRAVVIQSQENETPWRRFVCGGMAGATSTVFTYPLELVRIRLAVQTDRTAGSSWIGICRKIYQEDGGRWRVTNFYRGFAPTMLGILPYAGMSFLAHDIIGDWLRSGPVAAYTVMRHDQTRGASTGVQSHVRLTAVAQLCCGALAGLVAQSTSYPIDIVRRRMQVGNGYQAGILETARKIYVERGIRGFYVGLTIGYVKIVPMVATSFFVYDRMKRWLFKDM